MNKQISKSQIIRFRRWCRKGYAIFCSLGKTVAIGNLRKGIVEASLKKQPGVCLLSVPAAKKAPAKKAAPKKEE